MSGALAIDGATVCTWVILRPYTRPAGRPLGSKANSNAARQDRIELPRRPSEENAASGDGRRVRAARRHELHPALCAARRTRCREPRRAYCAQCARAYVRRVLDTVREPAEALPLPCWPRFGAGLAETNLHARLARLGAKMPSGGTIRPQELRLRFAAALNEYLTSLRQAEPQSPAVPRRSSPCLQPRRHACSGITRSSMARLNLRVCRSTNEGTGPLRGSSLSVGAFSRCTIQCKAKD